MKLFYCFLVFSLYSTCSILAQHNSDAEQVLRSFLSDVSLQDFQSAHQYVDHYYWGDLSHFSSVEKGWGGIKELDIYQLRAYKYRKSEYGDVVFFVQYFAFDEYNESAKLYEFDFHLKRIDNGTYKIMRISHSEEKEQFLMFEDGYCCGQIEEYSVSGVGVDGDTFDIIFEYIPYPENFQELKLNAFLQSMILNGGFDEDWDTGEMPLQAKNLKTALYLSYYKEDESEWSYEDDEVEEVIGAFMDRHVNVFNVENYLANVVIDEHYYYGGAHGTIWAGNYILDLKNGNILNEADIINEAFEDKILALIQKSARDQFNISAYEPLSSVFFNNELEISTDIGFSNEEIIFQYDPYEIACFAMGPIEIRVPKDQIKPFLKKSFVERVNW